jgi:TatD family-associated radical SAM protein
MERLDKVLETTRWIKKYHGNLVRIDTNGHGYLLNPRREVIEELREAGVDRLSVSVNAHNVDLYNRICRPQFAEAYESVLEFVEKSTEMLETEMTAVAIPEVDVTEMRKLAKKLDVQLRIRAYKPPLVY